MFYKAPEEFLKILQHLTIGCEESKFIEKHNFEVNAISEKIL